MANVLLIRYHRIGDALIVLPLIYSLARKYPEDTFTALSNVRFRPLFEHMPANVNYIPMVEKKPSGFLRGLSYIIRRELFFLKMKRKVKSFDKVAMFQFDTFEKKLQPYFSKDARISIEDAKDFFLKSRLLNKCSDGLTVMKIHKEVLSRLGYENIDISHDLSALKNQDIGYLYKKLGIDESRKRIAIAPFSKEKSKIYPTDNLKKVVEYFAKKEDYQVLILGGGKKEQKKVDRLISEYPSIISLINRISFSEEILLVAQSHVVLTMDSANLHLASLLDTPVLSVWGSTAPENGYYPEKESTDNAIIKRLDCQPCSIFGQSECTNSKQYECLDIDPGLIIDKIKHIVDQP